MRLQHFINEYNEDRTKEINLDTFTSILPKHTDILKYYKKGGKLFLRGGSGYSDFAYVKPYDSDERKSAYTYNYYTLISSNDPSWKHVPPRNRSVVGSTKYDKASGYNNTLYVVLPENGSLIGQSPSEDFWGSFAHAFGDDDYPLRNFNDQLYDLFKIAGYSGTGDDSISNLKSACNRVDKWMENNDMSGLGQVIDWLESEADGTSYTFSRAVNNVKYKGNFYDWLIRVFSPKNIKVVKAGHALKDGVEVWTDGNCLLIDYDVFQDDAYTDIIMGILK